MLVYPPAGYKTAKSLDS